MLIQKFKTIREAFANGTGDAFFRKNDLFVAINKEEEVQALELQAQGFQLMKHNEVVEVATDQALNHFAKLLAGVIAVVITDELSEEEILLRKQKEQN